MIYLKRDSKIFNYQEKFGTVNMFSDTIQVDAGFLDIEPIGAEDCTCFSVCKIISAQTGKHYDPTWLWGQMVKNGQATNAGATPQAAFSTAVNYGVMPVGEITPEKPDVAYFRVDEGEYDAFLNVKNAIQIEWQKGNKRPVEVGSYWYEEYMVGENEVMGMGKTSISAHSWLICGWDAGHPNMFIIDAHRGFYTYMPQEVFNAAMAATSGAVALTFAQTTTEEITILKDIHISLIERAIDLCYNLISILKSQIYGKILARD